jgi:hypothetical protein
MMDDRIREECGTYQHSDVTALLLHKLFHGRNDFVKEGDGVHDHFGKTADIWCGYGIRAGKVSGT